jgi:serine/threonine-protein kinase
VGRFTADLKPANILLQPKADSAISNPRAGQADGLPVEPAPLSEFEPKIADFGLARQFETDSALTLSGARVGTPSYMAPEQALGKTRAIGPSVDIYALGALLYELLTGRPPFRGETTSETEAQVVHQEPVPPSRLNPRVPRDLQTICLKCLEKDPLRRYATAAALADDLRRFGDGRPIQARPQARSERLWRWVRRNPSTALLLAAVLASVGLVVAGGFWAERQRAERRAEKARQEGRARQAVEIRLEQAAILEKQSRWPEARATLDGVMHGVDSLLPADLQERLRQAHADVDMAADLEAIRLRLSEDGRNQQAELSPEKMYAAAFANYGIPLVSLQPADAAARVRDSAIRDTLVAFLHDWLCRTTAENRARLQHVLDQADGDDWRRAYRSAMLASDGEKLNELANAPPAFDQPAVVLSGLGTAMLGGKHAFEALTLLRQAQESHPGDFWINCVLGQFLSQEHPQEAVGYFRVAVAIRPASAQAHMMLGRALLDSGDSDGAIVAIRRSVALNPDYAAKDSASGQKGGLEEAHAAWASFLERHPNESKFWHGYAQLCLYIGNESAYRRARKALLERFGNEADNWIVAERTSLACLMLPDPGDELRQAIRLADLAVAAGDRSPQPGNAYLRFVKGLALYRDGRPREAIPLLREATKKLSDRAGPGLALAMAQFRAGSPTDARRTLARAVREHSWNEPLPASHPDYPAIWTSHVLRREAEAMILPDLPAFLRGEYQPRDNDERLALLGICQFRGLCLASARLYAAAFQADPHLADQLTADCLRRATARHESTADRVDAFNAPCRYLAARCAALAGSGLGRDGAALNEAERAQWRSQARAWLRDDLTVWTKTLEGSSAPAVSFAAILLKNWQSAPELAGLREPDALDRLPADERSDCVALWRDVRVVLERAAQRPQTVAQEAKPTDSPKLSPGQLIEQGRLNEARAAWQALLQTSSPEHDVWNGYADLCQFLGLKDEARRARSELLARFGATTDAFVAERTSRTCLVVPTTGDELQKAVALAERAYAVQPDSGWFQFPKGLAEFRQGRFEQAISMMRGNASTLNGPAPGLVIAMALYKTGKVTEARPTFARAVLAYDWRANRTRTQEAWFSHTLRREAEAMILPNLPGFVAGTYAPADNDERFGLLGACQFENRTRAIARLYADAFVAAPSLADDLDAGHRYNAARAAALAGCGRGQDAADLDESERRRWRGQALRWLRADLAARTTALTVDPTEAREAVEKALARWTEDSDLACVREPAELGKLSAGEHREYRAFWDEVSAVLARTKN